MYSLNFENQCLIFIRIFIYFGTIHFCFNESYIHLYLLLRLLLRSYGLLNFNFWLDLILIFYLYKSKFIIMYAVSFIHSNSSPHFFLFKYFQGKFFSLQGQWNFFTITTVDNCLFHRTYRFPYRPQVWPLVRIAVTIGNSIPSPRIFTIQKVAGWQRSMLYLVYDWIHRVLGILLVC